MPTERILPHHRFHSLRQPVESAPHVGLLRRQPDAHPLRLVQAVQTRQPHHAPLSNAASTARRCSASNPGRTSTLRWFSSRISIAGFRTTLGTAAGAAATFTSTNFCATACASRFRQAKKCGAHRPRSRQKAATLCPLLACWEISFRHLILACFLRWVMLPACYLRRPQSKMGLVYRSHSSGPRSTKSTKSTKSTEVILRWRRNRLQLRESKQNSMRSRILSVPVFFILTLVLSCPSFLAQQST